jgi:hypothetical protein
MPEIRFTVSKAMMAYLQWLSKNVIPKKSAHEVAEYLVTKQVEKMRRDHRSTEPPLSEDEGEP